MASETTTAFSASWHRWRRAALRLLGLAARPVRTAPERGGLVLQPYHGYGTRTEIFLIGRVFRQRHAKGDMPLSEWRAELRDITRRISRRAVAGEFVVARFCGTEQRAETDPDGYFRIHLTPREPPPDDRLWHAVDLCLAGHPEVCAQGRIFIPPAQCRFVVISDIDDTIMYTGVANKMRMLWRLFVQDAASRTAFAGVAAFYRALHDGSDQGGGAASNPMLYVSRAPWGIYDVLETFFQAQRIPVGPILFLREWGISLKSPLPRKAEAHKRELIDNMLALYDRLPFVLIGDSGQHDPEVYQRIVDDHPDRVLAVYIRNVSRSRSRVDEICRLARSIERQGSTLLLTGDSAVMARHAANHGLIPADAVADVEEAMRAEGVAPESVEPVRATDSEAAETAAGGREPLIGAEPPPSVEVEGRRRT